MLSEEEWAELQDILNFFESTLRNNRGSEKSEEYYNRVVNIQRHVSGAVRKKESE